MQDPRQPRPAPLPPQQPSRLAPSDVHRPPMHQHSSRGGHAATQRLPLMPPERAPAWPQQQQQHDPRPAPPLHQLPHQPPQWQDAARPPPLGRTRIEPLYDDDSDMEEPPDGVPCVPSGRFLRMSL